MAAACRQHQPLQVVCRLQAARVDGAEQVQQKTRWLPAGSTLDSLALRASQPPARQQVLQWQRQTRRQRIGGQPRTASAWLAGASATLAAALYSTMAEAGSAPLTMRLTDSGGNMWRQTVDM